MTGSQHAAWCDDTRICGGGIGCMSSPPPGDPAIIYARHQTASDNRYGRRGGVAVWANVSRHEPSYRLLKDGSDDYLVGVVIDRNNGLDITELDLTETEARVLAARLIDACDMAALDREAVAK